VLHAIALGMKAKPAKLSRNECNHSAMLKTIVLKIWSSQSANHVRSAKFQSKNIMVATIWLARDVDISSVGRVWQMTIQFLDKEITIMHWLVPTIDLFRLLVSSANHTSGDQRYRWSRSASESTISNIPERNQHRIRFNTSCRRMNVVEFIQSQ